ASRARRLVRFGLTLRATRRLQRPVSRGCGTFLGSSRATSRHAVEHAVRTQIFVNVWPVNAVTVANQRAVRPLGRCCVRESPRPRKSADNTTIDQEGGNGLTGHFDVIDSRFNADRSA